MSADHGSLEARALGLIPDAGQSVPERVESFTTSVHYSPVDVSELPERLRRKIRVSETRCWEWQGPLSPNGYGRDGKRSVHRYVYELLVGPIPDGLHIDHQCAVRNCCNPAHLEAVTQAVNNARARRRNNPPIVGPSRPPKTPDLSLDEAVEAGTYEASLEWFRQQWAAVPDATWEACGLRRPEAFRI